MDQATEARGRAESMAKEVQSLRESCLTMGTGIEDLKEMIARRDATTRDLENENQKLTRKFGERETNSEQQHERAPVFEKSENISESLNVGLTIAISRIEEKFEQRTEKSIADSNQLSPNAPSMSPPREAAPPEPSRSFPSLETHPPPEGDAARELRELEKQRPL